MLLSIMFAFIHSCLPLAVAAHLLGALLVGHVLLAVGVGGAGPTHAVADGLVDHVVVLDPALQTSMLNPSFQFQRLVTLAFSDLVHGDNLRDVVDDDLALLLGRPVAVIGAARLQPRGVLALVAVDQYVVSNKQKELQIRLLQQIQCTLYL